MSAARLQCGVDPRLPARRRPDGVAPGGRALRTALLRRPAAPRQHGRRPAARQPGPRAARARAAGDVRRAGGPGAVQRPAARAAGRPGAAGGDRQGGGAGRQPPGTGHHPRGGLRGGRSAACAPPRCGSGASRTRTWPTGSPPAIPGPTRPARGRPACAPTWPPCGPAPIRCSCTGTTRPAPGCRRSLPRLQEMMSSVGAASAAIVPMGVAGSSCSATSSSASPAREVRSSPPRSTRSRRSPASSAAACTARGCSRPSSDWCPSCASSTATRAS